MDRISRSGGRCAAARCASSAAEIAACPGFPPRGSARSAGRRRPNGIRSRRLASSRHGVFFINPNFDGLSVPYTVIQVRLDCGVRLFSNPVGVEAGSLRIGMPVEAVFEDVTPDVTLLKFKPRKEHQ